MQSILVYCAGIGLGLPIVSKVMALEATFAKNNFATANGVMFAAGSLGIILFAPLIDILIQAYGFRGALMIYGALNLHICVGGLCISPSIPLITTQYTLMDVEDQNKDSQRKCCTSFRSLSSHLGLNLLAENPMLLVILTAMGIHEMAVSSWMLFLVSYIISTGYSSQSASFLSSIGGVGILLGRLSLPPLIDKKLVSGLGLFCILSAGSAVTLIAYPFTDVYWLFVLISLLAGVFLGTAAPVFVLVLRELFADDPDAFRSAVGLQYLTRGIGRIIGGSLTGKILMFTHISQGC